MSECSRLAFAFSKAFVVGSFFSFKFKEIAILVTNSIFIPVIAVEVFFFFLTRNTWPDVRHMLKTDWLVDKIKRSRPKKEKEKEKRMKNVNNKPFNKNEKSL